MRLDNSCSNSYLTTNTALAAYLQSTGHSLLSIDSSNPRRCVFVFAPSPEVQQLAQEWEAGTAMGNVSQFFFHYKELLARVREGER